MSSWLGPTLTCTLLSHTFPHSAYSMHLHAPTRTGTPSPPTQAHVLTPSKIPLVLPLPLLAHVCLESHILHTHRHAPDETSIKIPQVWGSESMGLVNTSVCCRGGTSQLHGNRSSCTQDPSGPHPMYLFILAILLYLKISFTVLCI